MNKGLFSRGGFRRKDNAEKNKKILVFFMAFVMIGSVFGVIFFGNNRQENKAKYNDFLFVQKQEGWSTDIDGREVFFNYLPDDVADLELEKNVLGAFGNLVELDTTSESNNSFKEQIALAEHQMVLALSNFNIYVRGGFTAENEFGMPVITCGDATPNVPVIYFRESNETKVYLQNNCIIAESKDGPDFLRIKDRLLYTILGILT